MTTTAQRLSRQSARTFALNGYTIVGTAGRKGPIRITRNGSRWMVTGGVWDKGFTALGDAVRHGNGQHDHWERIQRRKAERAAAKSDA